MPHKTLLHDLAQIELGHSLESDFKCRVLEAAHLLTRSRFEVKEEAKRKAWQ
jgi:hypothetical protein